MKNLKLTSAQEERLVKFGDHVWSSLTPDERDAYYCDNGTIGFVEDCIAMLHLQNYDFPLPVLERIHNKIMLGGDVV